jgi:outer membrane protein assembly factor BamB
MRICRKFATHARSDGSHDLIEAGFQHQPAPRPEPVVDTEPGCVVQKKIIWTGLHLIDERSGQALLEVIGRRCLRGGARYGEHRNQTVFINTHAEAASTNAAIADFETKSRIATHELGAGRHTSRVARPTLDLFPAERDAVHRLKRTGDSVVSHLSHRSSFQPRYTDAQMTWGLFFFILILAGDWPQFLGPTRNGVSPEAVGWPPVVVWRKDAGEGFAGPVVANGKVIFFYRANGKEIIDCLDASSGAKVWSYDYPTTYRDDFGFDEGPRSAPSIADRAVFTFGAQGVLTSLDLATGKKRWSVETNAKKGWFGAAGSPLVEAGKVLVTVGGIVAYDAKTGAVAWKATSDEASYSSPTVATIGGARHAFFFTRAGLVDLDPSNGQVRFSFPWRSRSSASVNAATPLIIGNQVFISAAYGTGAALLEVNGSEYKKVWSNDDSMSNHYSTCVYRDGFLYGFHGRQEEGQALRCVQLRTGKVMWNVEGYGAGTVTLAGDRLLILRESGELVLAPATADGFHPMGKASILSKVVRAYPALADGRLYARDEKTLVCVRLK